MYEDAAACKCAKLDEDVKMEFQEKQQKHRRDLSVHAGLRAFHPD